jgi:hypothetical protein
MCSQTRIMWVCVDMKTGDIIHHNYDRSNKYLLLAQDIGLTYVFDLKRKNILVVTTKFLCEENFISI